MSVGCFIWTMIVIQLVNLNLLKNILYCEASEVLFVSEQNHSDAKLMRRFITTHKMLSTQVQPYVINR